MRRTLMLIGLLVVVGLQLALPSVALAHPLDEYLQAGYITLEPNRVLIEIDLTPGVLVAPPIMALIDTNGDGAFSEAEGQAYAKRVLNDVSLDVDGERVPLHLATAQMPDPLILQAGGGEIRLTMTTDVLTSTSGGHQLYFQNNHAPVKSAHQVNVLMPKSSDLTISKQSRDALGSGIRVDYTLASSVSGMPNGIATNALVQPASNISAQQQQLFGYLIQPTLTPARIVLSLALAVVLGGLHALTPGHGKTLVAAYLVGSRGTVRHAALLGTVTTLTHTLSVLVVGLLALVARQFIVPGLLVPILEVGSGVLVMLMGARLTLSRWRALGTGHEAAHDHGFGPHTHGAGGAGQAGHTHTAVTRGSLLAMGVSGGLVPCPEALGIMLVAIGLNRAGFGLGLVVAFSFGLAAVLIGIGVLLVRSKWVIERFGGMSTRWGRLLPLAGAIIVTVLGIALVLRGVMQVG